MLRRALWLAAAGLTATFGVVVLAGGPQTPPAHAAQAFGWLHPAPVPNGWHVGVTRSGARLTYPASWQAIETDRGTASAAPAVQGLIGWLPERNAARRR